LQTPNKLSRKYESVQKICILRHLIPCSTGKERPQPEFTES
jgi:hypothetical protein